MRTHQTFGPPHAVLSLSKVGLRYFRIYLKASKQSREALLEAFIHHPNIGWIFSATGWFNLAIGIWARDNAEIDDIGSQIRCLLTSKDKVVYQSELTSLHSFGNRPVSGKGEALRIVDSTLHPIDLTPLELDYIKLAAMDSSIPDKELTQILNIDSKRLIKLEKDLRYSGVIVGKQERIAYSGTYYKVSIDTTGKSLSQVNGLIKRLWADRSCIYLARANSKYDLEFELILKRKGDINKYLKDFPEHTLAILTTNHYTNLYPLSKIANVKAIKDTLLAQKGRVIDFRNSKLWYLNHKGADAYLSIYENRKYFEAMEKTELELFPEIASYIRQRCQKVTFSVTDIGSGDGIKGRIFIEKLGERLVKAYYPIDIQAIELAAALRVHADGNYAKHPTFLDIENLPARFPLKTLPGEEQIHLFFGGTYGNFKHDKINACLRPLLKNSSSLLLVTMPIISQQKTSQQIIDSYMNEKFEDIAFGPLAQIGFRKDSFVRNSYNPKRIVHIGMEAGYLVSSFALVEDVTVFGRVYRKGTTFKMTQSWKPTLQQFSDALKKDFHIEHMFHNKDTAIALIA